MPLSNPVIRRYTPPTCTLEVLAQSSPLSRWMGKSVLKHVRFNLRFDDPRQPEEEKVLVQGDRDQLEALYAAVTNYVQEILQQSPENFWASKFEAHSASRTSQPATAVENILSPEQDISNIKNEFAKRENIYLQPSSNLTHQLFLGSLASANCGSVIQLSLLQLFDLATALDEYMADVVALPADTQRRKSSFALPGWVPVAAVLVLGLGLMPITYQYANNIRQQRNKNETLAKAGKEIGSDVSSTPLLTPLPTPNPLVTPLPNLSPLSTNGSGLNVPNASLPTPLASPNPTVGATQKPGITFPSASTNPSNSLSNIPLPPLGNSNPVSITGERKTLSIPGSSPSVKTNGGQVAIKPNVGVTSSPSSPKSKINLPSTNSPLTSLPSASLPPISNPSTPKIPVFPSKDATVSVENGINNQRNSSAISSKSSRDLAAQLRESRRISPANNSKQSTATTTAANRETLFDTNQVSEIRNYLSQRWQPPRGLTQPLQYSLTVGVDGALEQILPLGKAARDYVDRAGIPKIGEPFISPSRNGQNVRVRAILRPNGKVQTMPEKD